MATQREGIDHCLENLDLQPTLPESPRGQDESTGAHDPPPDFLLQGCDLPPADQSYLKIIEREEFVGKFGQSPILEVLLPNEASDSSTKKKIRWLAIVLPLHIARDGGIDDGIVPISFVVDTGASNFMYLGSGAVNALRELELIKDITDIKGIYSFRLTGKLCRGALCVDQPCASVVPICYEEPSIIGDPRLNLLGLPAMHHLKINIIFE